MKDAIDDLKDNAKSYNQQELDSFNNEYYTAGFSTIFMSRNRVRSWNEQSFTIQAGGRHAPLHPQAPKMEFVEQKKEFFRKEAKSYVAGFQFVNVQECRLFLIILSLFTIIF